jgi:hypothetical protein
MKRHCVAENSSPFPPGPVARGLVLALCVLGSLGCSRPAAPDIPPAPPAPLDRFESVGSWAAGASDGVVASAASVPGVRDQALALRFDFQGHGGHAGVKRPLPVVLPQNYEISFFMRGEAPKNDLQFKLVDASGDNVWWFRQRGVSFSKDWQRVSFKRRQLEFAWGPTKDRELERAAGIELVVAAGDGGRGAVEFDELTIRELPLPPAVPPRPTATASSNSDDANRVLDGRLDTVWVNEAGAAPSLQLDLGYDREFGGLVLRWAPGAFASRYDVEVSSDGQAWTLLRQVSVGNGERDALLLPESEARFLRLRLLAGPAATYALAELEVKDLGFGATPNAFIEALAREAPRGRYPRAFFGEQSYWTLVGVDAGRDSGLLSEDGALEVGRGGFTLEPFVVEAGELVSWADVEIEHVLKDGYLPVPSVIWRRPEWELTTSAFAVGDETRADLAARYELHNRTSEPLELRFLVAVRPLQANPPTQTLNQVGGFSAVHALGWSAGTLTVNGVPAVRALATPARVTLSAFDTAEFPERLPAREQLEAVDDPTGMASALLEYPVVIPPEGSITLGVTAPLLGKSAGSLPLITSLEGLLGSEESMAQSWREKLNRVGLDVPPEAQPLVDTLRSSLAHMLLSRDGPMLRPGTRSYARSWIRDGAMMSESLLRLGHEATAAAYFDWYAPYQFDGGKVPCCVDARGADPVPEHDSPGELIFLAAELHRFTGDKARLERAWPRVLAAASYMEGLRQSQRTPENQQPERQPLYGLLPPSISHEGYSDKPAYSYWDDFWALIGYQDAAFLAEAVGDRAALSRLSEQRDEFRADLYRSLRASASAHNVPFLPGAADRGDFDATSTTIALAPGREARDLPRDLLLATFERYWEEFSARRSGGKVWDAYTPYELRVAGSFIRLGWRERAQVLFQYFMADRRPAPWNQWAEVVGRDARQPRFIGDMPHAWISSDYIRSVLDLFVYARASDQTLVLAAGVPASWLDGGGVAVRDLRTPSGRLAFSFGPEGGTNAAGGLSKDGASRAGASKSGGAASGQSRLVLVLKGDAPPGGFVLPWPWEGAPADTPVTIDGKPARWEAGELRIPRMSRRVVIDRPRAN